MNYQPTIEVITNFMKTYFAGHTLVAQVLQIIATIAMVICLALWAMQYFSNKKNQGMADKTTDKNQLAQILMHQKILDEKWDIFIFSIVTWMLIMLLT